jgi:hypothetical protein
LHDWFMDTSQSYDSKPLVSDQLELI